MLLDAGSNPPPPQINSFFSSFFSTLHILAANFLLTPSTFDISDIGAFMMFCHPPKYSSKFLDFLG